MLQLNSDGKTFSQIPTTTFDPVATMQGIAQSIASISLLVSNAVSAAQTQAEAETQSQAQQLTTLFMEVQQALTLLPSLSSTIQPIIDQMNSQYPTIAAIVFGTSQSTTS